VLQIEEWGSVVPPTAVEVKPKEIVGGKVLDRHVHVLAEGIRDHASGQRFTTCPSVAV
jgi:hypothetical protein